MEGLVERPTYPELARPEVQRPMRGVVYPHPSLEDSYEPGTTEPWIAQAVCALLIASGGRRVLETGGFLGITSAWLALTLSRMGGGELTVAEIDRDRGFEIGKRLAGIVAPGVSYTIAPGDVLELIPRYADGTFDFAWVDDDHTKSHVRAEIEALWPKMRPGGLMIFHDVHGSVDLQTVVREYGGYTLDLPRLGPAGGLGIIQVT